MLLKLKNRAGLLIIALLFTLILCAGAFMLRSGENDAPGDAYGNNSAVFTSEDLRLYSSDGELLSAVPGGGYIAAATLSEGGRGAVTVYDKDNAPVFRWTAGTVWAISGAVSPDGGALAVLAAGDSGGQVRFFDLETAEETGAFVSEGEIFFDLGWLSEDTLCAVSESRAVLLSAGGERIGELGFDGVPEHCGFGDGYAVFALADFPGGEVRTLVSVGEDGKELGRTETEDVLSVSVLGKNTEVSLEDRVVIYDSRLREKETHPR